MLRLCSSSETRASLLKKANIEFTQNGVNFDEDSIVATTAKEFVYKATIGKYKEALKQFDFQELPLLVADTVVTSNSKILRKAYSKEQAKEILLTQSNSQTSIITCMIYKSHKIELIDISSTTYFFREFDEDSLNEYLNSELWRGKAGACMVEGFCKEYIQEVRGAESTAMGLHTELLKEFVD
ncbi:MAG: septum formation inhibitor Maf [Helicobacteraceae bacterium]|nr:septum formation inhibitor Maf [Helicobacteraceae bacterium]